MDFSSMVLVYLIQFTFFVIEIYTWFIIASVLISWLYGFGILNMSNQFVYKIVTMINRVTEPVLGVVRSALPSLGGLDLSPIVVLLALQGIKYGLFNLLMGLL